MITRQITQTVEAALNRQAAVALIGPRQIGKTTLALELAETRPSVYLDLESATDRNKLNDPELFLRAQEDKLVILDEIHRVPELFQTLTRADAKANVPDAFWYLAPPPSTCCTSPVKA